MHFEAKRGWRSEEELWRCLGLRGVREFGVRRWTFEETEEDEKQEREGEVG